MSGKKFSSWDKLITVYERLKKTVPEVFREISLQKFPKKTSHFILSPVILNILSQFRLEGIGLMFELGRW